MCCESELSRKIRVNIDLFHIVHNAAVLIPTVFPSCLHSILNETVAAVTFVTRNNERKVTKRPFSC